jgi:hypothetical protein
MCHVLEIGEEARRRVVRGIARLTEEWVVLQVAAVDEDAAIRQCDHAVAEHVPFEGLRLKRLRHRVPDRCLKVRFRCEVA